MTTNSWLMLDSCRCSRRLFVSQNKRHALTRRRALQAATDQPHTLIHGRLLTWPCNRFVPDSASILAHFRSGRINFQPLPVRFRLCVAPSGRTPRWRYVVEEFRARTATAAASVFCSLRYSYFEHVKKTFRLISCPCRKTWTRNSLLFRQLYINQTDMRVECCQWPAGSTTTMLLTCFDTTAVQSLQHLS